MYVVPGNCTPLGWQTTEGSPDWTWQVWGGSFLLLPRRHAVSSRWLWTLTTTHVKTAWKKFKDLLPVLSSRHLSVKTRGHVYSSCVQSAMSMPARLGHWQSRTSSVCSEMTGQWSDRSAMSGRKTLSPPGPMSYLCSLALRIWTSFWRREDSDGMDMRNAPMVQPRRPLTYLLMESVGLGGPKWHVSSWQRGIVESGSSRLSTLMIDVPGGLVWDLPCVQQASYLEGGPLMWMLPLYLHVNQKSDYDDGYDMIGMIIDIAPKFYSTVSLPYNLQVKVTDLLIILFIFGIQIAAMEAAPRPTHPHLSSKILTLWSGF